MVVDLKRIHGSFIHLARLVTPWMRGALSWHFRVTFVKVASASWTRALGSVVSAAENKLSPWTILLVGCHLIGHEALGRFFWPILRRDSSSLVPQSAAGRLVSSSSSSVVLNGLFLRLMFLGHGSSLLGHGSPAIVLKLSRPIPMAGLLSDATVTSISARFEMSTRCISDWYHWRVYHRRHKSRVLHQFPRFSQILPDSPRFSQILPEIVTFHLIARWFRFWPINLDKWFYFDRNEWLVSTFHGFIPIQLSILIHFAQRNSLHS